MKYNKQEKRAKYSVKSIATLLFLAFSLSNSIAQEAIISTGGSITGTSGSTSYSIGQVVWQTHSSETVSVAEGVQQPYQISVETSVEKARDSNLSITAYPNPVNDFISLEIANIELSELSYQLYDMNGKLLRNKRIVDNQTTIQMSNLVPSTYFIKVIENSKKAQNLKPNEVVKGEITVVKTLKIMKK